MSSESPAAPNVAVGGKSGKSASAASAGPGTALRAARKAMNVEPREVADALNLPLSVVVALEADDFAALPNPIFARGYVRSYAKLLELDPDPLVAQYPVPETAVNSIRPSHPSDQENPWASVQQWFDKTLREKPQVLLVAAGLIALLLFVLLLSWLLSDDEEATLPAVTPNAAQVTPNASSDTTGSPTRLAGTPQAPIAQTTGTDSSATETVASLTPVEEAATAGGGEAGSILRLNAGDDQLRFSFTEECWVDIQSGDGTSLYSDLGRPGPVLRFIGGGPFRILLGYAPGASLDFNGETVALGPHTRNNVATLVVGQ